MQLHQLPECGRMVEVNRVAKLMDHEVPHELRRQKEKLPVQADGASRRKAPPPALLPSDLDRFIPEPGFGAQLSQAPDEGWSGLKPEPLPEEAEAAGTVFGASLDFNLLPASHKQLTTAVRGGRIRDSYSQPDGSQFQGFGQIGTGLGPDLLGQEPIQLPGDPAVMLEQNGWNLPLVIALRNHDLQALSRTDPQKDPSGSPADPHAVRRYL